MRYGRRGRGGGYGRGRYPGNGPFSHLPPWERPGWIYGRGACWTMGYWNQDGTPIQAESIDGLKRQRDLLQTQLESMSEELERIEKRMKELESQ
ncbi:MAG: hypothetical protein GF411_18645 [Candidatus Lokiarchaeota archaeon]|nr:hypothetical protein [Candidatus Lokiarchaeota archaeon]